MTKRSQIRATIRNERRNSLPEKSDCWNTNFCYGSKRKKCNSATKFKKKGYFHWFGRCKTLKTGHIHLRLCSRIDLLLPPHGACHPRLLPVVCLHGTAGIFHAICFPVYGIRKTRRSDYLEMDRRDFSYPNPLKRLNSGDCEYTNGVRAYVQKIAGCTELYGYPATHAIAWKTRHSRYSLFPDFGDAEQYHHRVEDLRRDSRDLLQATEFRG